MGARPHAPSSGAPSSGAPSSAAPSSAVPAPAWDRRSTRRSVLAALAAALLVGAVSAATVARVDPAGAGGPSTAAGWLLVGLVVVVGAVVLGRTRRSTESRVLRGLTGGTLLLVLTSALVPGPAGVQLLPAGTPSGILALVVALAVLACAGVFWAQVLLLMRRRRRLLSSADAFLDAVSTVLVLTAVAGVLLVPHLGGGAAGAPEWFHAARLAGELVLTSTTVANGFLLGWSRDARLWKLTAIFTLLTAADALHLLVALDLVAPGAATTAGRAGQGAALALLAAAVWRPQGSAGTSAEVAWSQLLAALDVAVLGMVVLVLAHRGDVPTASVVLTVLAVALVVVKVALLFQQLLRLVDARRLASTDELTGLLNRRGLFAALHQVHQQHPVQVLLLDLDGFKGVNDAHGHHVGDALLQDTAARLLALVPPGAGVGRLGGDEFVVWVPDADEVAVRRLAREIAQELGPRRVAGADVVVGASIGTAAAPRTAAGACDRPAPGPRGPSGADGHGRHARGGAGTTPTCDDLIRRADAAMYEEKRRRSGGAPSRPPLGVPSSERPAL